MPTFQESLTKLAENKEFKETIEKILENASLVEEISNIARSGQQISFEQLQLALNLHVVRRFQTHRLQQSKSVAEHSFRVGMIYSYLGGKELIPSFGHDIEESLTGDIPSPAKKFITGLEHFEKMRPEFNDPYEARLGKLCDKLELVLDLREQLEDNGKLPKKLMQIYEDELEMVHDIAKELKITRKVKQLIRSI